MAGVEDKVMQRAWRTKYLMTDMNYLTLQDWLQRTDTVILPTSAIEQHGPHCPLGTDWYQALLVACEAAERAQVPVAAGMWFGPTPYHMGKVGAMTLREETFIRVMYDLTRSLVHHGFNRIIAICGHLANYNAVSYVARQLKYDTGAIMVNYVPFFIAEQKGTDLFGVPLQEFRIPPRHAGEIETGGVMAWNPDLVDLARAKPAKVETPKWLTPNFSVVGANEVIFKGQRLGIPLEHYEYCETGVIGNPVITQEQADVCYAPSIDYLVDLIDELRKIQIKVHQREFIERA